MLGFAGLFTVVWWSWMSSTHCADRFDHDDVVFGCSSSADACRHRSGRVCWAGAAAKHLLNEVGGAKSVLAHDVYV